MDVPSVTCVCFSPTGSTKTLAEKIARGISGGENNNQACILLLELASPLCVLAGGFRPANTLLTFNL